MLLMTGANYSLAATSDAEREDKKFMVTATITGLEFGTSSAALEAGKYLDSDSILSVKYTQLLKSNSMTIWGNEDGRSEEAQELWDNAGKGFAFSVEYKRFVSRTFYLKPSIYYRSQKIVHSTFSFNDDLSDSEAGSIHDSGISFRIGNQWQWSKFTLGCDWVGYSGSLVTFDRSGNLDDSIKSNLSLLNFYVGASF